MVNCSVGSREVATTFTTPVFPTVGLPPSSARPVMVPISSVTVATAAIVVYDITNEESLEQAEKWIEEIKEAAPTEVIIALAGNKMDAKPNSHKITP